MEAGHDLSSGEPDPEPVSVTLTKQLSSTGPLASATARDAVAAVAALCDETLAD